MRSLLTIITFLCLFSHSSLSNIDNFEGKIKIVKESIYDTLQIEISVKNDVVRIDEISKRNIVNRSYLVDLSKEKIYALSLREKLYTEVPISANRHKAQVDIIKTQNTMSINGVTCHQWRVRDKSKNTEVTYWVTAKEFGFMQSLISIISRSETPLRILGLFPNTNGYFPLLSVDRTLLRKVKESAKIVDIKHTKLPEGLFAIPPDFRELLS